MTITVVTSRKGGARDAVIAATRKLKAATERCGADSVTLSQIASGPDAGQWVIRIVTSDWAVFGRAMQAGSEDRAVLEAVAELDAISEVVSRRLLSSIDL